MAGLIATVVIALLVGGGFVGLVQLAGEIPIAAELSRPYTLSIIRFTIWQALLSTLCSIALAVPLARALHRRQRFFGRQLIIRLTSISLIVPTMVAILGIIAVHGRQGWINDLLQIAGFQRQDYLYGLSGILIAHVFFNLPLVTRLLLNGLGEIPLYQWKLAHLYGFTPTQVFRLVEWPAIRVLLPGAAGIVFLLCFTSFAIVLSLGGGPRSTTLEVAIYQAVRFDFDLGKAVALSLIQMVLCLGLALLFFSRKTSLGIHADQQAIGGRPYQDPEQGKCIDSLVLFMLALFLLSPFAAALVKTFGSKGWAIVGSEAFWSALRSSLLISIAAGFISTLLALAIAHTVSTLRQRRTLKWLGTAPEIVGMLTLMMPPITLGTGLFLLLRNFTDALSMGPLLVIVINAIFTLAFAIRILLAPMQQQAARFDLLNQSLGISGMNRWRLVFWPTMKKPVCYALAVSTTLSAGDMGVIALFGTDRLSTLPLLIYRLLGNYRLEQAAVVAVCLCALCLMLFWIIESIPRLSGRRHA